MAVPFSAHIVLNGRLLPSEQAHISVYNQALFTSFGVYESIQVDNGVSFHLDDHVDRLFQSAHYIQLPIEYDRQTIQGWVEELVETDALQESLLRILMFGPNGDEDTLVYILPGPLPHYDPTCYVRGTNAITFEGSRPIPQAKTLNTLVNYLAIRRARQKGAHEAFLVDEHDCLTEGSRSNLFVVAGGHITTPPAEQVLSGITRDLVWRMAQARGFEIREATVPRASLASVDEMFDTSTSMHIIPINQVDEQIIGEGEVGPVTRALIEEFESYYARVVRRQPAEALRSLHAAAGE
jgi:branched-chain amino acid aminotransferase